MAKWRVPVEWTMFIVAEIEAPTLELAIGVSEWQTEDEIRELYNDNQQDEAEESFFKFKRGDHVLFKGESQTVDGHNYWFPIAEDELRRADNISGAGIQELFD